MPEHRNVDVKMRREHHVKRMVSGEAIGLGRAGQRTMLGAWKRKCML